MGDLSTRFAEETTGGVLSGGVLSPPGAIYSFDVKSPAPVPSVETDLVRWHGLAAILMLFVSLSFGILASIELLLPDLLREAAWLSWGRLRYDHTQGILLGWLANAFFAFLYHAVPVHRADGPFNPASDGRAQWVYEMKPFAFSPALGLLLPLLGLAGCGLFSDDGRAELTNASRLNVALAGLLV